MNTHGVVEKIKTISQCANCQNYGHTKAYCGYSSRCVRCGNGHPTSSCQKNRDEPPCCALCQGSHPANYKGCSVYKDLQHRKKASTNNNKFIFDNRHSSFKPNLVKDSHPSEHANAALPAAPPLTYAKVASNQSAHLNSTQPAQDSSLSAETNLKFPKRFQNSNKSANFTSHHSNFQSTRQIQMNSSATNNSLLILQFNANGLKNHSNELQTVLHNRRIDIAIITETHFTKYSHIFIPGYKLIKSNHPDNTSHGGVDILIKTSLYFQLLPNYCYDHIQSCSILIKLNKIPITIGAFYSPPRHKITRAIFNDYFNTLKTNFIIGGDYNAKHQSWGCRVNNPRGIVLYNLANERHFNVLASPGPTYWPTASNKYPDILDIFAAKISSNLHCSTDNILDLNSDHSSSTSDIDVAVNNLTTLIQQAAWASTKSDKTFSSIKNKSNSYYFLLPEEIRFLITEKRRARASYQLSRLPSHKCAYNKLANSLKKILAKHKANNLEKKLLQLSAANGSLWCETKQLLKFKSVSTPLKKVDNTLVITDSEKSILFQSHLSNIFQPHANIFDQPHLDNVKKFLDSSLPLGPPIKFVTPNEVKNTILKYPNKKSPGFDLITAEVTKCLPAKAIVLLTYIINAILRLSYFPSLWKFFQIVMFAKPNKPADSPDSYRPISVLPFFSKICERLILQRMSSHINSNNTLPSSQFGFRAKHCTIHQVHRVVDAISTSLERKQYCSCVFLDISQAFDRIDTFQIRFGSSISEMALIQAGVPQGGILSPLLFNIYVSDQPITQDTLVADFADDKAIIAIHEDHLIASANLQIHLDLISQWYSKWRIKLNHNKSAHTTFTLKQGICPPVSVDNIPIPPSDTIKYLGLTLDERLTWKQHIRSKRLTLNARSRTLKHLLSKNKFTKLRTKLLLYKSLLKPIWTYGLQLWGSAKKTNVNKIQTFQNITLRKIANAPPYVSNLTLHNDLHMKTIEEESVIYYKRFFSRLANHTNPLIRNLNTLTLPEAPRRRLKRRWCRDLLIE
ncbi:Endonuclease/exonuclease/phosphatase,Reverse transcriptase domain [Cinara cedri]|uniref:Endonuclease/exonuclease/phosphatase,Reverse transcriptase domain n=1 Tax=Cinara cedri TaxID=506608 RepID=A0A5E4MTD3_9HEMI|nr:Endonuclease/exonuclease/phosphatase,Reverse transcriptase domain [Cinara cedri]